MSIFCRRREYGENRGCQNGQLHRTADHLCELGIPSHWLWLVVKEKVLPSPTGTNKVFKLSTTLQGEVKAERGKAVAVKTSQKPKGTLTHLHPGDPRTYTRRPCATNISPLNMELGYPVDMRLWILLVNMGRSYADASWRLARLGLSCTTFLIEVAIIKITPMFGSVK